MNKKIASIFLLLNWGFFSCSSKKETYSGEAPVVQSSEIKYAERFDIQDYESYKLITIDKPGQGIVKPVSYLLKEKDAVIPDGLIADVVVEVPIENLICTSTTQAALLDPIGENESLIGFPQTQYLYHEAFRNNVKNGRLLEVGIEAQLNVEQILSLTPDLVMGFTTGSEGGGLQKLSELGVPVVLNADYLETTLLGRAEWVKFAAAFFKKEREADLYFAEIVSKYDELLQSVKVEERPSVLIGVMYGSTWFMPGGRNHVSELVEDAGGAYLWSDNKESGWLNLDFEAVYAKAAMADIWMGVSDIETLAELRQSDPRYADFKAFKRGNVYSASKRKLSGGANDYFESGSIRPDLLLADHIKILHPELMEDYELIYYKKLE